jgi:hypothetical protein
LRRRLASFSSMSPGIEVGVDRRQNLPGISLPWR